MLKHQVTLHVDAPLGNYEEVLSAKQFGKQRLNLAQSVVWLQSSAELKKTLR